MNYKLEIWMRWAFLAGLIAVMGFSFYGSPTYKMMPTFFGGVQARRPHCGVQISRDFDHTASIGIPAIEALARASRGLASAGPLAVEACKRDPSLEAVYLRQNCDFAGGGQLSRTVYCK